ncbi:MAG: protein kinase, partial [Hyphomicrobiaceae bacterium]|nr:protein kinase [Hyphomicrobiaceae bacterium]
MDYREVLKTDTVLDRKYRIDRVIGAGGFGITYQAFDLGLASPVAVKEYYPSQFGVRDSSMSVRPRSDSDRQLFDRLKASFLREARTLAQFDHPAIVRVLSVFESHGTAYMVMKYESGPSLKAWLQGLGRSPRQSELDRLLWPLLDALEAMHRADFLHRDIAPDNIIVRSDGTPVLLDFGASRRVYTDMSGTLTGVVKQGYSPQEQYSSDVRVQGPWTDIYALGATLYLAVTGRVPTEATARMLEDGLNPALDSAHGGYRPEFLAAIDAAMQLHPRNRPQTVGEWRDMLFFGADSDFPSDGGEGYLTGGSGYASDRGPSSMPRTGTRSQSPSRANAPQRVTSQSRQTSQPRPSSRPGERQPQTGPKPSTRLQIPPESPSEPISPPGAAGTEPLSQRARQFATTPRGAMVLGVGALLLGGGMLLAFDGGRGSSVSTAGLSGSASIDAEREVRRLEAEHKRIAALDAERKAREDEARRVREAAEQERAATLDAARRAKEAAERKAKEEADRKAREEADKQTREAAERQRIAALEAARKAKEEADRKAREEADKQAREAAERQRIAALEAARKAKEEADRKAREEADKQAREAAERQRIAALEAARKAK